MRSRQKYKLRSRYHLPTRLRFPLLIALLLLLLPASFTFTDYLAYYQKIHGGVYVSGLHLGGLTRTQAQKRLQEFASKELQEPLNIVYKTSSWKLKPEEIVSSIDIDESIKQASKVGRNGNLLKQLATRYRLRKTPKYLTLQYSLNTSNLKIFLQKVKAQTEISRSDARIKIKRGKAYLITSRSGIEIQEKLLFRMITRKIFRPGERSIELPVARLSPHLTTEEAKSAFEEALIMLSAPAVLSYRKYSWTVKPEEIGDLITFKEVREKGAGSRVVHRLHAELDPETTEKFLEALTKNISISPKDATFDVSEENVKVISSRDGFQIDTKSFLPEFKEVLLRKHYRRTATPMMKVKPKLTTEMATSMRIKERISTFTTDFDSKATARVHNIRLLARTLDGKIVAPGDIFSFNEAMGPRTAAKGYKEAPTIINGELVPTYGGGVCQVGTTFFNTIFFGGYEIVERHNHSFYISRYPTGRDATVSYGGYDIRFKNDTPYHLLIKTASTPSSLTVTIYSTDMGRKVSFYTSPFTKFTSFESKYEPDPSLPKDQQVIREKGIEGRRVTVTRIVNEKGSIIHKDTIVSNYKPKKAVIRVGTGEAVEQPQPAVTAGEQVPTPQAQEETPSTGSNANEQQPVPDNVIQQNSTVEQQN